MPGTLGTRRRQQRIEPFDAVTCIHEVDAEGRRIGPLGVRGLVTGRDAADGGEILVMFEGGDAGVPCSSFTVAEQNLVYVGQVCAKLPWQTGLFGQHVQRHLPHNPAGFAYHPPELLRCLYAAGFARIACALNLQCTRSAGMFARLLAKDVWMLCLAEGGGEGTMVEQAIALSAAPNTHSGRMRALAVFGMRATTRHIARMFRAQQITEYHAHCLALALKVDIIRVVASCIKVDVGLA
tara:strand:- start:395 stop:1108 length:714 start_codon:yes stop_codon:yes gene_type:complete